MIESDDLMTRLRTTTDRLREAADKPSSTPEQDSFKRPYTTPSGAIARSEKAKNAYTRIQNRRQGASQ